MVDKRRKQFISCVLIKVQVHFLNQSFSCYLQCNPQPNLEVVLMRQYLNLDHWGEEVCVFFFLSLTSFFHLVFHSTSIGLVIDDLKVQKNCTCTNMFVQNFKICCFMCLLLLVDANKVIKAPYGEGSAQINTVKYQKLKFQLLF